MKNIEHTNPPQDAKYKCKLSGYYMKPSNNIDGFALYFSKAEQTWYPSPSITNRALTEDHFEKLEQKLETLATLAKKPSTSGIPVMEIPEGATHFNINNECYYKFTDEGLMVINLGRRGAKRWMLSRHHKDLSDPRFVPVNELDTELKSYVWDFSVVRPSGPPLVKKIDNPIMKSDLPGIVAAAAQPVISPAPAFMVDPPKKTKSSAGLLTVAPFAGIGGHMKNWC